MKNLNWSFCLVLFCESCRRSPFSVVTTLVLPAYHMAKRSHPFIDEASKFTGASSKSKPEGKRVLALAAVGDEKSSPLISAQQKTPSDDTGQQNPSQASGDRLHFPVPTRNLKVTELEASDFEGSCWMPRKGTAEMHCRHLDATSPTISKRKHRETACSPN